MLDGNNKSPLYRLSLIPCEMKSCWIKVISLKCVFWNVQIVAGGLESTHDTSIYFTETGNVVVDPEYQGLFPSKIVSRLTSWKRSTYEDFAILPHAQALVDDEVVDQSDIFFTAVIERGSGIFMSNLYLIFFIFIEICVIVLFLYDVGFKRSSTGILNGIFFSLQPRWQPRLLWLMTIQKLPQCL